MLSADTALEVRPLGTSGLDAEVNKPSDTLGVDRLERIGVEDLVAEESLEGKIKKGDSVTLDAADDKLVLTHKDAKAPAETENKDE